MSTWVHGIAELTGISHGEIELSLSHLEMLVPERGFCCLAMAVIAFCLVAAWQDARSHQAGADKNDTHHK